MVVVHIIFLLCISSLVADSLPECNQMNHTDPLLNQEKIFLESAKQLIEEALFAKIRDRGGKLTLSGDVRSEYFTLAEQKDGQKNVGFGSLHPNISDNMFRVVFSSLLDYNAKETWAILRTRISNIMGSIPGNTPQINMDRAFFGLRAINNDKTTIDIEIGRRSLNYIFDSRLQFGSFMDGIVIRSSFSPLETFGDLYINGGPFIVSVPKVHFAFVIEGGILQIGNTNLYVKYSIIDWNTLNTVDPIEKLIFRFTTHQITLGYRIPTFILKKPLLLYGAYLINSAARKVDLLDHKFGRNAFYLGLSIGELRSTGDWALDTNLQYVEPQAILDFDFSGIGQGNATNIGLYTKSINGTGGLNTKNTAAGRSNYIGWRCDFIYLFTRTITVTNTITVSHSLNFLPTKFHSIRYRLELAYIW